MGGPAVKEGRPAQGSSERKWVPTQDITQAAADAHPPATNITEENVPHGPSLSLPAMLCSGPGQEDAGRRAGQADPGAE